MESAGLALVDDECSVNPSTVELSRPDDEEYSVIVAELSRSKNALYELRLVAAFEHAEVAGGTLGTHLFGAHATRNRAARRANTQAPVPFGEELADQLVIAGERVRVVADMLADWEGREKAWRAQEDAKRPPAEDAEDPAA